MNFLAYPLKGRSTLRPTDILDFGWEGGKHTYVELTRFFPPMGLGSGVFSMGQVALKDSLCKVAKHEKACMENQHTFDTFSFLTQDVVELLNRL